MQEEIDKFSKEFANAEFEHAIVFSPTGKLFRLTGTEGNVNTGLVGSKALVGSIGVHNHPVPWGYKQGNSFSSSDVTFFVGNKSGIEYLVTGKKRYAFKYTGNLSAEEIYEEYDKAKFKVMELAFDTDSVIKYLQEETMRILSEHLEGFSYYEDI